MKVVRSDTEANIYVLEDPQDHRARCNVSQHGLPRLRQIPSLAGYNVLPWMTLRERQACHPLEAHDSAAVPIGVTEGSAEGNKRL